jgi:hypothetical protein
MKSILDPSFRYTASGSTNLQKTFERIRREQRTEVELASQTSAEAIAKLASIARGAGIGG